MGGLVLLEDPVLYVRIAAGGSSRAGAPGALGSAASSSCVPDATVSPSVRVLERSSVQGVRAWGERAGVVEGSGSSMGLPPCISQR